MFLWLGISLHFLLKQNDAGKQVFWRHFSKKYSTCHSTYLEVGKNYCKNHYFLLLKTCSNSLSKDNCSFQLWLQIRLTHMEIFYKILMLSDLILQGSDFTSLRWDLNICILKNCTKSYPVQQFKTSKQANNIVSRSGKINKTVKKQLYTQKIQEIL